MGNDMPEALAAHISGQSNKPLSKPAHALTSDEVLKELQAHSNDGLSPEEAAKRLEEYGKNELDNGPGVNPTKILVRQIANAMMLVCQACNAFIHRL
jgi:magnesium-transporting ATPase (P-type)